MKAATTSPCACPSAPRAEARPSVGTPPLAAGAVRSIDLPEGERCSLHIQKGTAWVTMEGDPEDHLLAAPCRAGFSGPGRIVIEAVGGDLTLRTTVGGFRE